MATSSILLAYTFDSQSITRISMKLRPVAAFCAAVVGVASQQQVLGQQSDPPNIVLILTDDQDVRLSSLDYMPLVKKHLIDKGTYYDKHYCTMAVCCPARVTLMKLPTTQTSQTSTHPMAGTPSSSNKASIRNICLCGCKRPDTMSTTLANCSTLTMWTITIHPTQLVSQAM
jgi:hypothetical protein